MTVMITTFRSATIMTKKTKKRKSTKKVAIAKPVTTAREAVAWKADRYIYCMSHGSSQVISKVEYLPFDSEHLWQGRKCDWCGKKMPSRPSRKVSGKVAR